MKYFVKILKESIAIVIFSSLMGFFSGTLLYANQEILYMIPIILLILPALNSLTGDISTVLVSRLTSGLYIGSIPPKVQKSDKLKENFFGLLITLLLSLGLLIVFGYAIAITTGVKIFNPFLMIFILTITLLLLFVVLFMSLFICSIYFFKRGKDPNNFLIPLLTSLADFLTPLFLIIFIKIFI